TQIAEWILHVEGHVAESRRRLIGEVYAEESSCCGGKRGRVFYPAISGNVRQFMKGLTILTCLHACNGGRSAKHVGSSSERVIKHQGYCAHGLRSRELVLNPCLLPCRDLRQWTGFSRFPPGKAGGYTMATAGMVFW